MTPALAANAVAFSGILEWAQNLFRASVRLGSKGDWHAVVRLRLSISSQLYSKWWVFGAPEEIRTPAPRFVVWAFGAAITIVAIISLYLHPPSDFYAIAIQIPHAHWIALSRLTRVGFHVENPIWLEAWEYGGKE